MVNWMAIIGGKLQRPKVQQLQLLGLAEEQVDLVVAIHPAPILESSTFGESLGICFWFYHIGLLVYC
jgi:hypothetical protein